LKKQHSPVIEQKENLYTRGKIFYIHRTPYSVGSEQHAGRPGIIVSDNAINNGSVVMVVYLTSQFKKQLPSHASISSTGRNSTALCEQIDTVDRSRIGAYIGTCTDEEFKAIEIAMLYGLGIRDSKSDLSTNEDQIIALNSALDNANEKILMLEQELLTKDNKLRELSIASEITKNVYEKMMNELIDGLNAKIGYPSGV